MHAYLISLLALLGVTGLTWTPLATKKIGFLDIIPSIFKTAQDRIFSLSGNGLSIIAFAFLIYAFLESKVLQDFFLSSDQEKWKKRKNWVIITLTIFASTMSTFLFWYDEYILFFPLIIPLFLNIGLDKFSSFLCLFGGASAGLMSNVAPEIWGDNIFSEINVATGNKTAFTATDGIKFRLVAWLIFTAIFILFNIWYCNKIYHNLASRNQKVPPKLLSNSKKTKKKLSRGVKWLIGAVFGLFIVISILGSVSWFAGEDRPWVKQKWTKPEWFSSSYEDGVVRGKGATGEDYKKVGTMDKEIITDEPKDRGKQQHIATVEKKTKEFWPKFGEWGSLQTCSLFVVGAIIICLLSRQNIANTLITAFQKTVPIILAYIFMTTAATISQEAGMPDQLKKYLLSEKVTKHASILALFSIFFSLLIICFFVGSLAFTLFLSVAPALYAISPNVLLYGAMIMLLARFLAISVSPTNAILMNALQEVKVTYKEYIKKTWVLWLIVFLVALGLVSFCAFRFR